MPKVLDTENKELRLLPIKGNYTEAGKKDLLKKWISMVRF